MKKLITVFFLCSLTVSSQEYIECKNKITKLNLKIETLEKRVKALEIKINNIATINTKSKPNSTVNYYNSTKKKHSDRSYYRGSRGGCYYYNSNGNKQYVPRSLCN